MISRELVKEVHTEARNLKKTATAEELARLDFGHLRPIQANNCIYGQATGSCFSDRAHELILKCAKHVIVVKSETVHFKTESCNLKLDKPDTIHESLRFSPIEVYIDQDGADNKQLIAFLKGERKTLNLMGTVNC